MTATVCTIIARNYLAQALILGRSLAEHHPGSRLKVLVIDAEAGVPDTGDAPVDILAPEDIMSRAEFDVMAGLYTIVELATAVKPWLLATLVDGTGGPVLYLDPDIKIYKPLDRLLELATDPGVVLTPHLDVPPGRADGRTETEDIVMSAGVHNLGFCGVGPAGRPMLDWWQSRLARECVTDPSAQRFVDQRWMDMAPGYFPTAVIRDPEYNVAWWNLSTREVTWDGAGYRVNGRPLGFFHFSGYSPKLPHLVSKHQGHDPRVLVSEHPGLARILAEYAADLQLYGHAEFTKLPNALDVLPNGVHIDVHMRRLYRAAVLDAERRGEPLPPNPYAQTAPFFDWLREPARPEHAADPVSLGRYAAMVRRYSKEITQRFPDVDGADHEAYVTWFADRARVAGEFPVELIPPQAPPRRGVPRGQRMPGVNLVGYLRTESGVGEAARQIASGLEAADIPFAAVDYPYSPGRQGHPFPVVPAHEAPYDVNLLCINADQILTANHWLGAELRNVGHRIGVWWWEVAEFPEFMHQSLDVVDELWVGSPFVAETFAKVTAKPVKVMPLPVVVPEPTADARAALDIAPDTFLVLFSFDFESVFARKNPLAAIEAYRAAFPAGSGATLLVKTINGHRHLNDLERLRFAAADRPDIRIVDGYLDHAVKDSLMAACDCYLSLHRSEGFGLTMAEAMAHGRPVVATGYSGNMRFMTAENSWPVPWAEGHVPADAPPYPAGTPWAEPDVPAAARMLQEVRAHPEEAARRGERARRDILEHQSPAALAEFAAARLAEIRRGIPAVPAGATSDLADTRAVLLDRLNRGGDTPWDAADGGPEKAKAAYRRGMLRALRPYLVRRDQIDRAIVARTDQIAEATGREAHRVDELTQIMSRRVAELEAAVARTRAGEQELRHRLLAVESELHLPAALDLSGERHWVRPELARVEMARRWSEVGDAPAAEVAPTPLTGFEYRCTSQNGEDGVLCEIFRRIGTTNRWFVEFGIESGVEGNGVLLAQNGWSGLFMEPDDDAHAALAARYAPMADRVTCLKAAVTRENVNALFAEGGVPAEPDLVSIDVDGVDYWLWDALEYRPRVLMVEYNAALGFEAALTVPYDPSHRWDGTSYMGASLAALTALGHRRGYQLVHTERCGVNAFFVRSELAEGRFPAEDEVPRHPANYFFSGGGHPPDPQGREYQEVERVPPA